MTTPTQPQPRLMTDEEVETADRLWTDYLATHDLADQTGRVAGIDPGTGEIVIADSISDVVTIRGEGAAPLLFKRIGYAAFSQKGAPAMSHRVHLSTRMTVDEIDAANRLWDAYQATHDLSGEVGRIAAIEPHSGAIVIVDTAGELLTVRGKDAPPALLKRIGSTAFYQKGGRR